MSNGKMSPLFLTQQSSDKNLERLDVDFTKVRRLRGTSNSLWVSQIYFMDQNNQELTKLQSYQQQFGPDQELAEGEEIIGIHGTRNGHNQYFATIGFIVWKPPRMAEIARAKKVQQGELVKSAQIICRNPAYGHRPDAKAVPGLNYMKMLPQEEASKVYLQEI
jgi:hypothetical protein